MILRMKGKNIRVPLGDGKELLMESGTVELMDQEEVTVMGEQNGTLSFSLDLGKLRVCGEEDHETED